MSILRKAVTTCILFSLIFSSCAPLKRSAKRIDRVFENSAAFNQGFSGLVVYDPEDGKTLYSRNGDRYFTPASNMKLFTFYTGLKLLGDSLTALKYASKGDSLIFKGNGDPSFLYEDFNSQNVLDFLKKQNKQLFYVPPNYTETPFGPGWAWDDYNDYYQAERNDFPIYGNVVVFERSEGKRPLSVLPEIFEDSIQKKPGVQKVVREPSKNRFYIGENPPAFKKTVPFVTSVKTTARLLSDTLHQQVEVLKDLPPHLNLKESIKSVSADSVYKAMLFPSDNFIAEQLLLMAAAKISDTLKTRIAIDYMLHNELSDLPDEPQWRDGSGLSRYNLVTPRTLVALVEKIKKEVPLAKLKKLLPAGGESGTIGNYYKAQTPYIYAKTGSLSNNHSLTGLLLTKSGKVLSFSFMNSNYVVSSSRLKAAMEEILIIARDSF